MDSAPQPKAKKSKKKKDEAPADEPVSPDAKKPKKKAKKSDAPDLAPPRIAVADISCEDQLSQTVSWKNVIMIKNKASAGIPSNTNFRLKTQTFDQLNPMKEISPILPQSTLFGKTPNATSDPFGRRKIP